MGSAAGKRSSAEPTFKNSQPPGQSQWTASALRSRTHHKEKGSGVGAGRPEAGRMRRPGCCRRAGCRSDPHASRLRGVGYGRPGPQPPPILAPAPPIRPRPRQLRTPGSAQGALDPCHAARAPPGGRPALPRPGTRERPRTQWREPGGRNSSSGDGVGPYVPEAVVKINRASSY